MSREEWLVQRKKGQLTIEALWLGIFKNKTVKIKSQDELVFNIKQLQKEPFIELFISELIKEAKMQLDRFFDIVTLHDKRGIELQAY